MLASRKAKAALVAAATRDEGNMEVEIKSSTTYPNGKQVIVADWKGTLPSYIRWLHRAGIDCHAADEYTADHIMGFKVGQQDLILCPDLDPYATIYLVYKDRRERDPRVL